MKTKLTFLAAISILLFSSWIVPASTEKSVSVLSVKKEKKLNPDFEFFRTHRQGRGIMTTWGLSANQNVTGFVVQKTYEDPNDPYSVWQNICAMPCGAGRSFKYHDLNIFPGYISYRVVAYLQSGGSIMSSISTVHIISH